VLAASGTEDQDFHHRAFTPERLSEQTGSGMSNGEGEMRSTAVPLY
jgi:hypothetical protein